MLAGAQGSCKGSAVLVSLTAHASYNMTKFAASLPCVGLQGAGCLQQPARA